MALAVNDRNNPSGEKTLYFRKPCLNLNNEEKLSHLIILTEIVIENVINNTNIL